MKLKELTQCPWASPIEVPVVLALYFIAMLGIGLWVYKRSSNTATDYLLGGRQLGPAVTALSAGASDMSGWVIMGLPGALYLTGLSNIWIGIGLLVGAYANYRLLAPRLRLYTEMAGDAITLPDFFEKRFEDQSHHLRTMASVVIIVFFTVYTSSGLVGGGKLFESIFGLSYFWGVLVTAAVVVAYTFLGGFLAVSLTDFVQGCIMFVALILVPVAALISLDGPNAVSASIMRTNPALFDGLTSVPFLGVISALAWGLGYFGQPHIIVRFMAIRSVADLKVARRIGMGWMAITLIGAMSSGFIGVALVAEQQLALSDPETILILMSQTLFHPLVTGFILAAILAAIMSTVSSQLLVTASSLAEDVYAIFINRRASPASLVLISRSAVLLVAVVAVLLALPRDSSILWRVRGRTQPTA